jgi:hypothetical protein
VVGGKGCGDGAYGLNSFMLTMMFPVFVLLFADCSHNLATKYDNIFNICSDKNYLSH